MLSFTATRKATSSCTGTWIAATTGRHLSTAAKTPRLSSTTRGGLLATPCRAYLLSGSSRTRAALTATTAPRTVFCRFRHTESASRFKEFGGHGSSRRSSPSFRDREGSFRPRRDDGSVFGGLEFQGP